MGFELPRDGDVVVSKPTATVEHVVAIVPEPPHLKCRTHEQGVAAAQQLALELHVDAWLTENQCQFMKIASHRP